MTQHGKYTFPGTAYNAGNYTVLCINTAVIPFFRLFFAEMQERWRWETRNDWARSYQVFAEMEHMLMGGCVTDLIIEQQRLYRLIDSALNGTSYTTTTDPETQITTVDPAIPAAPAAPTGITSGLRRQLLDMQGVINAGWFGIGGQPATIADLVNTLRVGSDDRKQSLLDTLAAILSAAGSAADVFGLVESLLADTVDATGEGAIVGVLIASTMAQTAMLSNQAQQMTDLLAKVSRLITSLDGGAEPAPATNVITELQNTNVLLG